MYINRHGRRMQWKMSNHDVIAETYFIARMLTMHAIHPENERRQMWLFFDLKYLFKLIIKILNFSMYDYYIFFTVYVPNVTDAQNALQGIFGFHRDKFHWFYSWVFFLGRSIATSIALKWNSNVCSYDDNNDDDDTVWRRMVRL